MQKIEFGIDGRWTVSGVDDKNSITKLWRVSHLVTDICPRPTDLKILKFTSWCQNTLLFTEFLIMLLSKIDISMTFLCYWFITPLLHHYVNCPLHIWFQLPGWNFLFITMYVKFLLFHCTLEVHVQIFSCIIFYFKLSHIHTLFNIHDEIKPIRTSDIKIQDMHWYLPKCYCVDTRE